MNPSSNVFLIGPMGAGKSTLGRRLAARFDLPCVDLDNEIEQATGAEIPLIFEYEGEAGFRARESQALARCAARQGIVLACGGGIVLAPDNRECLMQNGFVVYLDIDVDEQLRRLKRDHTRPLLATPDRRERLLTLAEQRNALYRASADLHLRCASYGLHQADQKVAERVADAWQRLPAAGVSS